MNISLGDLAAVLQEAVMQADRQGWRTQHQFLEEAAGRKLEGLPGKPVELSLMPADQMALQEWVQEWPCRIVIDDDGKVKISNGDNATIKMTFRRGEQSEVMARYRDKEVERLVFTDFKEASNG